MYVIFLVPLLLSTFTSVDYDTFTFGFLITFNLLSIIILVVYVLSIRSMNGEETEQSEETSDITYKRIGIMFGPSMLL